MDLHSTVDFDHAKATWLVKNARC